MMKLVLMSLSVWLVGISAADAYCRQPMAPTPPTADKPRAPSCLDDTAYGRSVECDSYTLQTYKSEVKRYEQALQRFINESQRYANDAFEFAKCEMREIEETMPRY